LILVDANVLLYAYHPRSSHHDRCRRWLEAAFSGDGPVALCWLVVLAFLRISTSARAFEQPLTMAEALAIVSEWLALPAIVMVEPGPRHWETLHHMLSDAQVVGPMVTDAAIAALALEHGAAVCTTDRDFRRFSGLRLVDPLAV
jgi:toxin-antitoxin system PIN domain toxin